MRLSVQKNGTPCRKPRKSGGSPRGVSEPPMLLTKKIKNTTICTLDLRLALARNTGRINTMEAPVVPTHEAMTVPINSITVLTIGFPRIVPRIRMPPDTVNNPHSKMIKGM